MLGSRHINVIAGDVLVINGYEVDATILLDIVSPDKRVLWAFVAYEEVKTIQPIPYDESRIIWLAEEDLIRSAADQV